MRTHDVIQGSDEWHKLRSDYRRTASTASIMMNLHHTTTRAEHIRMTATGTEKEFSDWAQRNLLDKGHAIEAPARQIAESIIGEDLFPATATSDDGYLLASFDGITMDESVVWECKLWNEAKAAAVRDGRVPESDYWQVVQQLVVSGAEKCLYMVTDGTPEKTVYCWMKLDPADRDRLIAGWRQFDADLANYQHVEVLPPPTVAPIENLPALFVALVGEVKKTNMVEWHLAVKTRIAAINENLRTDEDFVRAKKTVSFLEDGEKQLAAAKEAALAQTASIAELFAAVDSLSAEMRTKRLALDKLVKAKEISIRAGIASEGKAKIADPINALNKRLG